MINTAIALRYYESFRKKYDSEKHFDRNTVRTSFISYTSLIPYWVLNMPQSQWKEIALVMLHELKTL